MKRPPEVTWFCYKCKEENRDLYDIYDFVGAKCLCPIHHVLRTQVDISGREVVAITSVSKDITLLESMIELKKKDPIEYQLKLAQFKTLEEQKEQIKELQKPQHKCPFCGCTQFTPVRRNWSVMTGVFTNKVDLICNNCGRRI